MKTRWLEGTDRLVFFELVLKSYSKKFIDIDDPSERKFFAGVILSRDPLSVNENQGKFSHSRRGNKAYRKWWELQGAKHRWAKEFLDEKDEVIPTNALYKQQIYAQYWEFMSDGCTRSTARQLVIDWLEEEGYTVQDAIDVGVPLGEDEIDNFFRNTTNNRPSGK